VLIDGSLSAMTQDLPGEIWQAGYHAHRVVDEDDLRNYILNNPAKKRLDSYLWVSSSTPYACRMDSLPMI
jgi:putative transposase